MKESETSLRQPHSDSPLPPVVLPECHSLVAHDPPVVVHDYESRRVDQVHWFQALLLTQEAKNADGEPTSVVYGVTRVFDLFTLMAITLAFALLFALLKLLSPAFDASPATVTFVISGYVTLIALAQMFMFGGKNPRLASIVAGPIAMFAMLISWWVPNSYTVLIPSLAISSMMSALFGFFLGYLAGAVVAGVLLIADVFRGRSPNPQSPSLRSEKDLAFDELE